MAVRDVVQAAAGALGGDKLYVEDVFSTYLYTGNGSTQTINNGIALSEEVVPALNSLNLNGSDVEVDSQGNYFKVLSNQVVKYSSTGSFIWGKTLLSTTRFYQNIAIDSNDDVIVCQTYLSTSYLDVYKFSGSDGTLLWKKQYSNVDGETSLGCFGTRIFIVGSAVNFRSFVIEINSTNGTIVSSRFQSVTYGSYNRDLAIDATNSLLYVAGNNGGSTGSLKGHIFKYDISNGNLSRTAGVSFIYSNDTTWRTIAVDSSGNVYVAGSAGGSQKNMVAKFNSSLTEQWSVFFNADLNSANKASIAVSSTGKILARLGVYNSGTHVVSLNPASGAVIKNSYFSGVPGTYSLDRELIYRNGKFILPTSNSLLYEIPDLVANESLSAVAVSNTTTGFTPSTDTVPSEGSNHVTLIGDLSFTVADATISTFTVQSNDAYEGSGGLVWTKTRNVANSNWFIDTVRGGTQLLRSNTTEAQFTAGTTRIINFNSSGYTVDSGDLNTSTQTEVSWTFRKAEKFFDVVTYAGTGSARTIAHNLNSVPGCIIVKRTDTTSNWQVYHRSNTAAPETDYLVLNSTAATADSNTRWNDTLPTSTVFSLGTDATVNASGGTYVAYLFAHDAGGFGDDGQQNVISCGSYTGNGSTTGPVINLGWEPQWVMIKNASTTTLNAWRIYDSMRGLGDNTSPELKANLSDAETTGGQAPRATASGFEIRDSGSQNNQNGSTYIYIAIRRGPMKTPESGTEVFDPDYNASFPQPGVVTTGFVTDWNIYKRTGGSSTIGGTRLTGGNYLFLNATDAERAGSNFLWDNNTGLTVQSLAGSGNATINWAFRRAPGFFDVVCYTGDGTTDRAINHNLGVSPQLMILKLRNSVGGWIVYTEATSAAGFLILNNTAAYQTGTYWGTSGGTAPTDSQFTINGSGNVSTYTYVTYLFATVAGVSKVGSYTGTGTTQQINCGFSAGARFVLIKRTDSTGDWYVWDTARGIMTGNDPYLLLNSDTAEVTSTDYIDTYSAGFEISSTAPAAINASGGSFIFLAIA